MSTKHTPGPWHRNVNAAYPIYAGDPPNHTLIAVALPGAPEREANYDLIARAPELLAENAHLRATCNELAAALKYAGELIPVARNYFPKAINNSDRFTLENTCAAIGSALHKYKGE